MYTMWHASLAWSISNWIQGNPHDEGTHKAESSEAHGWLGNFFDL